MPSANNDLMRIIVYGEALRAVATYLSTQLIAPPYGATLDLLDDAYARMARQRGAFSPEDFGVYVMSLMLEFAEDEEDVRQVRAGAARYVLDVKSRLAPDLQMLAEDARATLAETGLLEKPAGPDDRFVCVSESGAVTKGLARSIGALAPEAEASPDAGTGPAARPRAPAALPDKAAAAPAPPLRAEPAPAQAYPPAGPAGPPKLVGLHRPQARPAPATAPKVAPAAQPAAAAGAGRAAAAAADSLRPVAVRAVESGQGTTRSRGGGAMGKTMRRGEWSKAVAVVVFLCIYAAVALFVLMGEAIRPI